MISDTARTVELQLTNPGRAPREHIPVTLGVPFPQGELWSLDNVALFDEMQRELPCQLRKLSSWRDGSVKWMLFDYQADIGPTQRKSYVLSFGNGVQRMTPQGGISIEEDDEYVKVTTDLLRFSVPKRRFVLLGSLDIEGNPLITSQEQSDLVIRDGHGEEYRASLDDSFQVAVEEQGPLRSTIKVSGVHVSPSGRKFLDYVLRLHVCAHSTALRIEHTFTNREEPEEGVKVTSIALELALNLDQQSQRLVKYLAPERGHGYHRVPHYVSIREKVDIRADSARSSLLANPASVGWDSTKAPLQIRRLQPPDRAMVEPWLDVSDGVAGATTGFRRMTENFPKGLSSDGNRIIYSFWPSWADVLEFPQGMAKTHELLLNFHRAGADAAEVDEQFSELGKPLCPVIPCQWYQRCQVNDMENVLTYQPDKYPRFELLFRSLFDRRTANWHHELAKWFWDGWPRGMLNYGDDVDLHYQTIYEDLSFFPRGEVWMNNEYDELRCAVTQYCRTGSLGALEMAEIVAQHQIDVDQIHRSDDPMRLGGMPHHSPGHVTGTVFPSHLFAQGLLGYYCLTGRPAILEGAIAVGENLLRWVADGWDVITQDAREGGWPLLALSSLYEVTGEERFLQGARKILAHFLSVSDGGRFYGSPVAQGVTFDVVIAMMGTKYYHRVTGDERAKALLLEVVNYRLKHHCIPEGISIPLDEPWMFLEILAYAYKLTGDERYVTAGMRELKFYMDRNLDQICRSSRPVAMCYRSLVYFLRATDQLDLLKPLDY